MYIIKVCSVTYIYIYINAVTWRTVHEHIVADAFGSKKSFLLLCPPSTRSHFIFLKPFFYRRVNICHWGCKVFS